MKLQNPLSPQFRQRVRDALVRRLYPSPVQAHGFHYSMLYSEHDEGVSHPTERLIDVSLEAIKQACRTDLSELCRRRAGRFKYPDHVMNLWPGEHYRLLAGFVQALRPSLIIEIGTAEGLSALSMVKHLARDARLVSFDIVPWQDYPRTCLVPEDFSSGQLQQIIQDIGQTDALERYRELFSRADLLFIDAAKDGILEPKLMSWFSTLKFNTRPIFIYDDIRFWNMLAPWRTLAWPKLDLTSFGHWCGTGICEPGRTDS